MPYVNVGHGSKVTFFFFVNILVTDPCCYQNVFKSATLLFYVVAMSDSSQEIPVVNKCAIK